MLNQQVRVTLQDHVATIEAEYSDERTSVMIKTSYSWSDAEQPFTVEELRRSPAKLGLHLLKKITGEADIPPGQDEQASIL